MYIQPFHSLRSDYLQVDVAFLYARVSGSLVSLNLLISVEYLYCFSLCCFYGSLSTLCVCPYQLFIYHGSNDSVTKVESPRQAHVVERYVACIYSIIKIDLN